MGIQEMLNPWVGFVASIIFAPNLHINLCINFPHKKHADALIGIEAWTSDLLNSWF